MSINLRKVAIAATTATLFAAAGVGVVVGVANAQSTAASPAEVIKSRQQGLKDLGASFKLIRDQVQSGSPDAAKVKAAAADVKKAADLIATWFPKGTGAEAGVKTAAKPDIWNDAAGFSTAVNNFVQQANTFNQLVNAGDATALVAGVKPLGQTCGGCHDKFRFKES